MFPLDQSFEIIPLGGNDSDLGQNFFWNFRTLVFPGLLVVEDCYIEMREETLTLIPNVKRRTKRRWGTFDSRVLTSTAQE